MFTNINSPSIKVGPRIQNRTLSLRILRKFRSARTATARTFCACFARVERFIRSGIAPQRLSAETDAHVYGKITRAFFARESQRKSRKI